MINVELIKNTVKELLLLIDKNEDLFYKSYRSLPYPLYKEIESLSISKSLIYKDLCDKAKIITDKFHSNSRFVGEDE